MKILVLGGTVFVGRHITQAALEQAHEVTLFNRGQHGAALFPGVERLLGDRDGDMGALRGRRFDAVIDCSGYTPAQVKRTAEALDGETPHYTFISSISVYASFPPGVQFDETAAVASGCEGYGALKARAEEAIDAALPGCVARLRPGLIVGPHDPTGRFIYWPTRVARGGDVLAPGSPDRLVQFIDARDLALWCLELARRRITGVFNAVGPHMSMASLLEACRVATGSNARFVWLTDEELMAQGVAPWTGLPLWIPQSDPSFAGMLLADNRRAVGAGLVARPVEQTIRDTFHWAREVGPAVQPSSATLLAETEARCLAGRSDPQ
jgi:nucleoside-diphosphate-sugar epimerase